MKNQGKIIFWIGVSIAVIVGAIISYDPGAVCQIDADNLPESL